ncbi:hypothetical protein C943_04162 [Mariniradius saccharolyticus AK6]|uniref:BREX system P-loop protein BrxC n=1 Tax=Mariniradius saccharolyticus AK6 TaxID=1239962 RepID=M7XH33_9BACT|nr:BREX system P-loop protein BrxC [Mariniradius saccharolyticus]EMS33843.1 hypothetical protein C943_04162 [Mariniradius saccharolyticus AK6]
MKNKDLFNLNPTEINLKNDGVAKIKTLTEVEDLSVAEYELRTFVCEGEYHDGLKKIFQNYLTYFEKDIKDSPAFWVSGFYGSGKSHLVKMASYLWEDFQFPNGSTARTIKPLPTEIKDLLTEIDRKQKIYGKLSVSGTLRDFPSKDIRYSFLQILLSALELPQQYHHFKFVHWTMEEGIYDSLKQKIESQGRSFRREVENLFVSTALAKALLELKPDFASSEAQVREIFRAQYPRVESIGRDEFVRTIKEEILPLKFGDKIPCTLIVLDEVQQFIATDADLAFDVQLLAEDLCSRFDGRFLLVGTGQNALQDTPILQKLMARFRVPIQLTDTDIQKVIRKTILEKKASAVKEIQNKLEYASGEISRNLAGTDFGFVTEDKDVLVADYPILPSTRKFWNKILKVIDTAGTTGMLRNQLRTIDESLKSVAESEVGRIVPSDFIFNQNETQLIQSGLLLSDTFNLIQSKKAEGGDGLLEGRILSAVFLIEKLTNEVRNTGLKSNEAHIAELLIDDLNSNSDTFRTKVKELIKKLVEEKVLMPIEDEYRLQTKVGAEWEQEFRKHHTKIANSGEDQIQNLRKERILAFFKERTKTVIISHGVSKMTRPFELWDKDTAPNQEDKLHLWIKDGWYTNESVLMSEIRAEGNDSPLAFAYVAKQRDMDLRTAILNYLAAKQTVDTMGLPTTLEGQQAKKSMETRKGIADQNIQELIDKICKEATILLAGGNKMDGGSIKDNIESALYAIADRQFYDFKNKADFANWGKALTKAIAGSPDALEAIGYRGEPVNHPVSLGILNFLGNQTKTGKDIRNHFSVAPYGWSQDAIDTMLVILKRSEHLSSTESDLKTGNINQASFKKEIHTLTATQKIAIKKLLQEAGIQCPPNQDIFPYSNDYLDKLKSLAEQISGDPPKLEKINTSFLKEISNKEGNERLLDLLNHKDELSEKFKEWTKKAELLRDREPDWNTLQDLRGFCPESPDFGIIIKEIDAIWENRLLFQEPDPIKPLLTQLTEKLGTKLGEVVEKYLSQRHERMEVLQENEYFKKLSPEQKHVILTKNQLLTKYEVKINDATNLANQLQRISLENWKTKISALQGQFDAALTEAIELTAPKAKSFYLPKGTINNQAELDKYLADLKSELESLLQNSSSIILK